MTKNIQNALKWANLDFELIVKLRTTWSDYFENNKMLDYADFSVLLKTHDLFNTIDDSDWVKFMSDKFWRAFTYNIALAVKFFNSEFWKFKVPSGNKKISFNRSNEEVIIDISKIDFTRHDPSLFSISDMKLNILDFSQKNIASKDEFRPMMMGLYFDEDKVVATDSHILIVFPATKEVARFKGKIINWKTKKEIDELQRYPPYKSVLPEREAHEKTKINVDEWFEKLRIYETANKYVDTPLTVEIIHKGILTAVNSRYLLSALKSFKILNIKTIDFITNDGGKIYFFNDDVEFLLMGVHRKNDRYINFYNDGSVPGKTAMSGLIGISEQLEIF